MIRPSPSEWNSIRKLTYCNPLPLPDYPRGPLCTPHEKAKSDLFWCRSSREDFRELADPSVVFHEGAWYLYASGTMAWVSRDFVNWEFHRIEPSWIGYAPTVVRHRGQFLLTACGAGMYISDSPLGPFKYAGDLQDPAGNPLRNWADPMLFSDGDERLYAYWGLQTGIFGVELDSARPWQALIEPHYLFNYDPSHVWERSGERNQFDLSYVEGAWMFKGRGRYYLTYTAPGTELTNYGIGVYVADSPLGPSQYQDRNPILRDSAGLVHGTGHGCVVKGPGGTQWAFYTCLVRINHWFERRIGMDPVGWDEQGQLYVRGASETPQLGPGVVGAPETEPEDAMIPVSLHARCRASSEAPGRDAYYALDGSTLTWWQAAPDDAAPAFELQLKQPLRIGAIRLQWKEPLLDFEAGRVPAPFRYTVEAGITRAALHCVVDRRNSADDMLIDYQTFDLLEADVITLRVESPHPAGIGLIDFTVFGWSAFAADM